MVGTTIESGFAIRRAIERDSESEGEERRFFKTGI